MLMLHERVRNWLPNAHREVNKLKLEATLRFQGEVTRVGDGVARVRGLPETQLGELLQFSEDTFGIAVSLAPDHIGTVLLDSDETVIAGCSVQGTGRVAQVPVGEGLLGRVVDPLGRANDGGPPLQTDSYLPVERPAPAVLDRDLVARQLHTGVLMVDSMLPIGRGQRELIVGDRATGKTSLTTDIMVAQRDTEVICVYAAIGQNTSAVKEVIESIRERGAIERCIFVVAESDGPAGLQWLAPYAACSMAEFFRDRGQDVLLVLDDLSKHAAIHRQLALLQNIPHGREAYPGDIFYAHSRLLERAAQLSASRGGGSLTCLPIAETQGNNLTAYIPTNLVSMTDGQLVLRPELFYQGQRPAIDVGLSVSRVGGKTQVPAIKSLSANLRIDYAQFLELEVFSRLGEMVDEHTRRILEQGRRMRSILRQKRFSPWSLAHEVVLLLLITEQLAPSVPESNILAFSQALPILIETQCIDVFQRINTQRSVEADDRSILRSTIKELARNWTD